MHHTSRRDARESVSPYDRSVVNKSVIRGENERFGKVRTKGKMAEAGKVYMQRLLAGAELLLDLSVRFHALFGLHGRKFLGNDL
jgi:hypothetical protein